MIIAGLGNPGKEYENTRHNVGFLAIEALAGRFRAKFDRMSNRALVASFSFKGEAHLLAKPQTYMNLSGDAIAGLLNSESHTPSQLLVVVDDINLPVGKIRLRSSGCDGGHNGLKSIIGYIGIDFWRLRIGVGLPKSDSNDESRDLVNHVLGPPANDEKEILDRVISDIPDLVAMILLGMGGKAMSRYNGKNYADPDDSVADSRNSRKPSTGDSDAT